MRNGEITALGRARLTCPEGVLRTVRSAARLGAIFLFALAVSGCGIGALFEPSPTDQDGAGAADNADAFPNARPRAAPSGDASGAQAALSTDLSNFKERLIGLSPERIEALFGSPSLARAEPPATIWQYRQPGCTVDIFLFEVGGVTRVDHVDVRGVRTGAVDERTCFRENLQRKISGVSQSG